MSTDVHGSIKFYRIPLEIPSELIYGNLRGFKREDVKSKYESWLFDFARFELNKFKLYILKEYYKDL